MNRAIMSRKFFGWELGQGSDRMNQQSYSILEYYEFRIKTLRLYLD